MLRAFFIGGSYMFSSTVEIKSSRLGRKINFERFVTFAATAAFTCGSVLTVATFTIWIIALFKRWNADGIETIMFAGAFILFALGAHWMDLTEKEKIKKWI